jgi:hypothetical protein
MRATFVHGVGDIFYVTQRLLFRARAYSYAMHSCTRMLFNYSHTQVTRVFFSGFVFISLIGSARVQIVYATS